MTRRTHCSKGAPNGPTLSTGEGVDVGGVAVFLCCIIAAVARMLLTSPVWARLVDRLRIVKEHGLRRNHHTQVIAASHTGLVEGCQASGDRQWVL
jgi:hypothetical protein